MNIESLLKLAKYADEQILRGYSKLTKKWEDKGRSRYVLAGGLSLSTFGSARFSHPYLVYFAPLFGMDIVRNLLEPIYNRKFQGKNEITLDPGCYLFKKITNPFRLPLFLTGIGLIGKSGYEFFDYFRTGNGESLNSAISDLSSGYSFFGLSSSIYIKDSDQKLLDKAPFWKTAYDWTKEKVKSLAPQPVPQPSPAFLMENYLPAN